MTVVIKYIKKDNSFVVRDIKSKKILYDGRSKKYKEWIDKQKIVIPTTSEVKAVIKNGEEKQVVITAIFEAPLLLGIKE